MDRVTVDTQRDHQGQPQPCRSQTFGEIRHRLVNTFLWQHFAGGLQGDLHLICCLRLRLEFIVLFQHGRI